MRPPHVVRAGVLFELRKLLVPLAVVLVSLPGGASAQQPAAAGDWPQWRGPDRTNVSAETGLLKEWPETGPPLLWKTQGLGSGVVSLSVAGGRIFTLGYRNKEEYALAFELKDGKKLWEAKIGPAVRELGIMRWLSQRTPTVDGDHAYAVTAFGELICLQTDTGKELWRKNYAADFGGKSGPWGYCDFPLVDGERLICTPGGQTATVVALNKKTGEAIWKCAVPGSASGTHAAAVISEAAGIRQYVHQLECGTVGVAAADGKFLWHFDKTQDRRGNVYAALVRGDRLFCVTGFGGPAYLLKLTRAPDALKVEEEYTVPRRFQAWLGSAVLHADRVYICSDNGLLSCFEFRTGKPLWERIRIGATGQVSLTMADGRLYLRFATGKVLLVQPTAEGAQIRGQFEPPRTDTQEPTWTFPVVVGRRLYLRDQDVLLCYDVADKKQSRRRSPDVIFAPSPEDVVAKMLDLAGVKKEDLVYDLGCGDGRIVVAAAKKYGCIAAGFDIDRHCVKLARELVHKEKVGELVRIEQEDIFTLDLSKADVVTLYLSPELNAKLIPQLEKLKSGARIVSHAFDMPGVKPDKVITVTSEEDGLERKVYLWTTPLKKEQKGK